VARFAGKVEVVADATLATFYPQHWPAEVEIEADGKVYRRRVVAAAGDPERPLRRADVNEKGHRVLDPLLGAEAEPFYQWLRRGHEVDVGFCSHGAVTAAARWLEEAARLLCGAGPN
jgi:2-methylcitrate dehydratase PrpD